MPGLVVLITNHTLAGRTGTEIVVRDLALGLQRRGHQPIVYTPQPGPIADELLARTVPVVTDLARVAVTPDAIHGHHMLETALALLRFPGTPAVFVCHDWSSWYDQPPRTPLVRRYLAVDETCRDRLCLREGIPAHAVGLLHNAVDLDRFTPRAPLPPVPGRALMFSNYVREDNIVGLVRAGCDAAGVELDVVGAGVGSVCAEPEQLLGRYDVVFGKGRCALEALAVGAAVVLCDAAGFAGLVTTGNMDCLRRLNFGRRALVGTPVTDERVAQALGQYQAEDAMAVSQRIRAVAGLDPWLDELIALYQACRAVPASAEERAALLPFASDVVARGLQQFARHDAECLALHHGMAAVGKELQREHCAAAALREEFERLRAHGAALTADLRQLRNSAVVRWRERVAGVPLVGAGMRALGKCLRGTRRSA